MKTFKLPPRFYFDHVARDLPEVGITSVVSESKRHVFVEMDADAFDDLHSDARYYSDSVTASQMGMPGLASSARATLAALDKQGRPEPRLCDQCAERDATVYAIDPIPGGWGGHYCEPCAKALRFQIIDRAKSS